MAERKLGDQWIEVIDGKRHMLKAVDNTYNCNGCTFLGDSGKCLHSSILECPVYRIDAVIKDLGILNEEGLIPCPFCWEYPTPKEELDEHDERIYAIEHECNIDMTTGWDHDKRTVIDNWNRRA